MTLPPPPYDDLPVQHLDTSPPPRHRLPMWVRVTVWITTPLVALAKRLGWEPLPQRCSRCGRDLPAGEAFYVENRRYCAECVEKVRRGMIRGVWGFVGLSATLLVLFIVLTIRDAIRGSGEVVSDLVLGAIVAAFPLLLVSGLIWMMKRGKTNADQQELNLGRYHLWKQWLEEQRKARDERKKPE